MQYWTEGSSARKRGWYDNPIHTGREIYHPSFHDRKSERQASIEYIEPPERYALNHPIKTAVRRQINTVADKTVAVAQSISTKRIQEFNLGMILATKWINLAIGILIAICGLVEWCVVLFGPIPAGIKAETIWSCGFSTAIICTTCILIYRYHCVLERRFDKAACLRKRANIVKSLKKTIFLMARTLVLLYVLIIPNIAQILHLLCA